MQRIRHNDYWDTFSLYLENTEEDPATKNEELAKKLSENRVEGEKRLSAVFEEYSKKQEEMKEEINEDNDSVVSDEEDESVIDDEELEKDDLSEVSSDLENGSEEPDVETDKIGLENNENSATNANENVNENTPSDVVLTSQNVDEHVPNTVTVKTIQRDKKVKIISVEESDVVVSKIGNKTILRIQMPCTSNAVVKKTQEEVLLTTVSTTDRTNNITKTEGLLI